MIDGDPPLAMNYDNDDMQRYCIGQDQCPYSIWGSLPFPDETYDQLDKMSSLKRCSDPENNNWDALGLSQSTGAICTLSGPSGTLPDSRPDRDGLPLRDFGRLA